MVDISLYRGDLHKVPDVPRRWTPQTPKISHKDFKILIERRASALSRLRSSDDDAHTDVTPTSSPSHSPSPASRPDHFDTDRSSENDGDNHVYHQSEKGDLEEEEGGNGREELLGESMEEIDDLMEEEIPEAIVNMVVEESNAENGSGDLEKRKMEVKEKLEILNEKKHSLVQVLKQILSAEEHLKRHNRAQGTPSRPPLNVDTRTITDSGSVTKVNTPRVGPNGNPCADVEGGEADDASNHNLHSLNLPRMSSTSPSSGMVPHFNKITLVAASCTPSRAVTVSGTSYIASTPSPAASVGTSGKLPSPWN